MGLPKLKKCCGCSSLESGGLIIGWIYAIFSLVVLAILITTISIATVSLSQLTGRDHAFAIAFFTLLMIVCGIYLIYMLILLVASILLIRAVQKRDYTNVMPFLVLVGFGVILSFLQLLTTGVYGIGPAIISAAIDIYVFLVVYSLYDIFRNERLNVPIQTAYMSQPPMQQPLPYGQHPMQQPGMYSQPPIQQPAMYGQQYPPPPSYQQQPQPASFGQFPAQIQVQDVTEGNTDSKV